MPTRRDVSIGLLVTGLLPSVALGQGNIRNPRFSGSRTAAAMRDAVNQAMAEHQVPGLSVALTSDRETLWTEGFGLTDQANHTPVTPQTLFSVQSISKTYTTTAFMTLVGAGTLRLDQTLRSVVPEFTMQSRLGPNEQDVIAFRDLLAHRAGLPHEAPRGGNWDDCGCSFDDHIRSVFGSWLKAGVRERYSYSNVGIDLVGYAMQRRLGMPFEAVMQDKLLRPLGMTSSTFDLQRALASPLAHGQLEGRDVPLRALPIQPSGGMYSNVLDMARFVRMHLNRGRVSGRQLVPAHLLDSMGEIQEPVDHQVNGYGLGLERRRWRGRTILTHGGGGFGFQTEQRWSPQDKVGVVVLTNYGGDDGVAVPIAERILELYLSELRGGLPPNEPPILTSSPVVAVPTEILRRLEGRYRGYSNGRQFGVADGTLYVQAGETRTPLQSHGPAEFTTANERYRFRLDNFARPILVEYLGPGGVDTYFPNGLASDPPGPAKPEWSQFVGDYEGMAFGVIPATSTISLQNGYLHWTRSGGTRIDEYRSGHFFASDGEALIFTGDAASLGNRPFRRKRP